MSFGYFMNMEKLSLRIVEKHLPYMTDNNYEDDCFLNIEELINNIENGFVIITQLSCYFESFLNTVINASDMDEHCPKPKPTQKPKMQCTSRADTCT